MATANLFGPLTEQSQQGLLKAREDRLLGQLQNKSASNDDATIRKAARDFESILLTSWLQQAEQTMATVPGAGDEDDAATRDQMLSLGAQSLSSALSASGGIGIGKMIIKALEATEAKNGRNEPPKPGEAK